MKIGFSTPHKFNIISRLIIFFTKKKALNKPYISHSFPIFGRAFGMQLGLSSDELLNNIVDINRYRDGKNVLRVYELPDRVLVKNWVPKVVEKYNQKIYPHLELVPFLFRWFIRLFKPDFKGKNWFNYSTFCSELSILVLREAGYMEELKHLDANFTDAIELENEIIKMGGMIKESWE